MFREAHAVWQGSPYAGEGKVSTPSGILTNATYAFGKLAEIPPCAIPCEIFAAAIASCFSTMVAREMASVGLHPDSVDVYAVLNLDNPAGKWQVTGVHLTITADAANPDLTRFEQAMESAQRLCLVSSALKVDITCKTKLTSVTSQMFT